MLCRRGHNLTTNSTVTGVKDVVPFLLQKVLGFAHTPFDDRYGFGVNVLGNKTSDGVRSCGRDF